MLSSFHSGAKYSPVPKTCLIHVAEDERKIYPLPTVLFPKKNFFQKKSEIRKGNYCCEGRRKGEAKIGHKGLFTHSPERRRLVISSSF